MPLTPLSKEEINKLPMLKFPGEIVLPKTEAEVDSALADLNSSEFIGFDTETRPSFKKGESYPITLLQLSTEKTAYLFRLRETKFTDSLKGILSAQSPKKIGAAIHDDIKGLQELNYFEPGGFIELQEIAKNLKIKTLGLRNLTAILLRQKLSKRAKLTNWDASELSQSQLFYAATDAWVSRALYLELMKHEK